ncbi:hypothetical protein BK764_12330 [Bacillus thuringiensis serovar israelensis]|nr:hypothetical protein ATN07_30680 [Bacillus thuringiensis serovar israelensis]EEM74208.1 hypothetical protein bthur0010_58680 [Bacillus thuringiensis serovar pondicheriensis BGSC 4BA1]EEM99904.1 hypothetical protein bthur0014_54000 [Bacillus thuringiensis IBL 4222]KAA8487267.1 hypothetical protein FYW98_15230 [Bacillus thuringiensis]KRD80996.1 hypothetical protein ASE53_17390 [Bacillus sp. Root11]KRD85526.1 hypothetical protein ASE54_17395 [Bacillus sp. Root131]OTX61292.1 hypothetical prote
MNLYFQTEEQKERFVRECTDDGRFTCHIKLGLELGFPPFACEVVGKNINLKDDVHEKYKDYGEHWLAHNDSVLNQELEERGYIKDTIGINYHGVQFGMERGTAKETYEWLLENMPVPSNLQTVVIVKDNFTFKKIEQYIQENEV